VEFVNVSKEYDAGLFKSKHSVFIFLVLFILFVFFFDNDITVSTWSFWKSFSNWLLCV